MTAFRSGGSGGARGNTAAVGAAAATEKRRRTAAMGKSGLQGYLTSAQDALLRGFWQVRLLRHVDSRVRGYRAVSHVLGGVRHIMAWCHGSAREGSMQFGWEV